MRKKGDFVLLADLSGGVPVAWDPRNQKGLDCRQTLMTSTKLGTLGLRLR